jgi:hypothetical protein
LRPATLSLLHLPLALGARLWRRFKQLQQQCVALLGVISLAHVRQDTMADIPPSVPASTLEKYPDHAQAIGMASVEIANLEIMLGELLGALLHIDRDYGALVYLTPKAAIARLDIIENVASVALVEGTDGRKEFDDIVYRAKSVIGRRHGYIHDAWGTHPEKPNLVVRRAVPFKEKHPSRSSRSTS